MSNLFSRRHALQSSVGGFGYLALSAMAARAETVETDNRRTHHPPRAKRVLFLCMAGGPSHVDSFDYKPELQRRAGQDMVVDDDGRRRRLGRVMASPWEFNRHGESGLSISELFPEIAKHADKLCLLRGMQTKVPAHPQAFLELHTGSSQFVRPSLGSWTVYGLGTENQNLPAFISLSPSSGNGGAQNYGNAFLPAPFQGTPVDLRRGGIANINNPRLKPRKQREQLDLVQSFNRNHQSQTGDADAIEGVIQSYELAFRMQSSVPDVMNIDAESEMTRRAYGLDESTTASFGRKCLTARRLLESGVRFVEVTQGGWDQHNDIKTGHGNQAALVDRPIAALLGDLADRGLLDETLVLWGGEFGRTPVVQGGGGRDHNHLGYTMWMAGGGVKPGYSYGGTDPLGRKAIEGQMNTHDLHATILHLLGLDHQRLTYNYAGRDFRLTDVYGNVAHDIIA